MRAMSFGRVFFGSKFFVGMTHFLRTNPRLCIARNFAFANLVLMNLPHPWKDDALSIGTGLLNGKSRTSRRRGTQHSGAPEALGKNTL